MTVAELIIADAHARGLRHFFGLPGGGFPLDIMDAGRRFGVDFVSTSHESSAAIMAAYYGVLKQTAGLALSVRGVGAGNLLGGIINAHFERVPVVAVCETVPTSMAAHPSVQYCNQFSCYKEICKYATTVSNEDVVAQIQAAVFHSTEGRPGPSLLNIPADLSQTPWNVPLPATPIPSPSSPDSAQIALVRAFLQTKKRLVVVAGADVIRAGATEELRKLVESLEAVVLVTMDARGVFPEQHRRWAGVLVGSFNPNLIESKVMAKADGVIVVGADAMMTHVPWKTNLPVCEFSTRSEYAPLSVHPELRIDGDLKKALRAMGDLKQQGFPVEEIQSLRRDILLYFKRPGQAHLAAQDVIEIVRRVLPPEGILFSETGAFICMLEHLWPVERPGTYYGTSGGRTMGLMMPAILGARLAERKRPMIGIGADGSLLMRLGELEVFKRTGAVVPLVILNDQALGTMKSRQKSRGMPDYGLDLSTVDFAAIARACGLHGVHVEDPNTLEKELQRAMVSSSTTLIDARVDSQLYQDSFAPTIGVLKS